MNKLIIAAAVCVWGAFVPAAFAAGRQDFRVVNHTGHTVVTLQLSSSASPNWGPDVLGADFIANNDTAMIAFERDERNCIWDIRVTYDDDTSNDLRQQNLCELSELELTAS